MDIKSRLCVQLLQRERMSKAGGGREEEVRKKEGRKEGREEKRDGRRALVGHVKSAAAFCVRCPSFGRFCRMESLHWFDLQQRPEPVSMVGGSLQVPYPITVFGSPIVRALLTSASRLSSCPAAGRRPW